MPDAGKYKLDLEAFRYCKSHYDKVREIPDGAFTSISVPSVEDSSLFHMEDLGLLKVADTVRYGGSNPINIWYMSGGMREIMDEIQPENRQMLLPCGHAGFTNVGDWQRPSPAQSDSQSDNEGTFTKDDSEMTLYSCNECNGRFTREEIE